MKYLPILLLALLLGAGDCNGGGGGGGMCSDRADVTVQFTDQCVGSPVVLDRLSVTYPDGAQVDVQAAFSDPPGVYRIPQAVKCEEHSISVTAAGYQSYVDSEVKFYEEFLAAQLTPIGGCI